MKHALRVTAATTVVALTLEVALAYGVLILWGPPETSIPWMGT